MRFANPPGIAAFMQKNAGYDKIGGRAIKDAVDQDLETMSTMGQAQSNALSTVAKDKAAEYMRDAQAFGMAKKADAEMFDSITDSFANLGGAAFKKFGSNPLPGPQNTNDFSVDDAVTMGMDRDAADHIAGGGFVETVIDGDSIGRSIFN